MSTLFDEPMLHTIVVLSAEKPKEYMAFNGIIVFPFEEKALETSFNVNRMKSYPDNETFFTSVPNSNVIVKSGSKRNLAFTTQVPAEGSNIPIKYIGYNKEMVITAGELTISEMIKLSTNSYVVNPGLPNECFLVTP